MMDDRNSRFKFWLGMTVILVGMVLMGIYFCAAQDLLYSHCQPFYDSMAYYDQMHMIMMEGQQNGTAVAVRQSFESGSTVFLPFLIASLISTLVDPTRNVGVWIQMAQLTALLVSLFYYFRVVRKSQVRFALVMLVPFVVTTCFFKPVGGLSDFRMDLSLYLTYAISCIWYLIAVSTEKKKHFLVLGLAIAVSCLFRATAPIYLILGLGPLAAMEIITSKNRKTILAGLTIGFVMACAGALWFYLLRYNQLHYYYFVWNTDANAKLPLSESVAHVEYVARHLGKYFLIWLIGMYLILLNLHWSKKRLDSDHRRVGLFEAVRSLIAESHVNTDWRMVWLAIAPVGMLVLRGAGLNPYVSIPALLGIVLWLINPIVVKQELFKRKSGLVPALIVSCACVILVGIKGWDRHSAGDFNSMSAHKTAINWILEDAKANGIQRVNFDSTHVFYFNSSSLSSSLRFDFPSTEFQGRETQVDGLPVMANRLLSSVVAQANWEELEGPEDEKIINLISRTEATTDYLIVPTEATIDFLEEKVSFNVINQHQRELRNHVLNSGNWVPVKSALKNGKYETVEIYRNQAKNMRFTKSPDRILR